MNLKKAVTLFALFFLLAFFGCEKNSQGPQLADSETKVRYFDDIDGSHWFTDPVLISRAKVASNTLTLTLSYSGGCETHDFELFIWNGLSKSDPPQAEIFLSHNAHGDLCEAYLTEERNFDLSLLNALAGLHNFNGDRILLRIYAPGNNKPFEPLPVYFVN